MCNLHQKGNFPNDWRKSNLWDLFAENGTVVDVYVARKNNKEGKRFGFARFVEVVNVVELQYRLNQIWIRQDRLRVNIAKFKKSRFNSRLISRDFFSSNESHECANSIEIKVDGKVFEFKLPSLLNDQKLVFSFNLDSNKWSLIKEGGLVVDHSVINKGLSNDVVGEDRIDATRSFIDNRSKQDVPYVGITPAGFSVIEEDQSGVCNGRSFTNEVDARRNREVTGNQNVAVAFAGNDVAGGKQKVDQVDSDTHESVWISHAQESCNESVVSIEDAVPNSDGFVYACGDETACVTVRSPSGMEKLDHAVGLGLPKEVDYNNSHGPLVIDYSDPNVDSLAIRSVAHFRR